MPLLKATDALFLPNPIDRFLCDTMPAWAGDGCWGITVCSLQQQPIWLRFAGCRLLRTMRGFSLKFFPGPGREWGEEGFPCVVFSRAGEGGNRVVLEAVPRFS